MILLPFVSTAPPVIRLEAESARVVGGRVASERPGFSGTGYVTDITPSGAKVEFATPPVRAGLYRATLVYSAPSPKGFEVSANGFRYGGMFAPSDGWSRADAGAVELREGVNLVAVERGWGYYDLDAIELTPFAPPPPPKRVSPRLTHPKATAEARALMRRLTASYGRATLLGQYRDDEWAKVGEITGRSPAILGEDLMEYSPSRRARGVDPKGLMERLAAAGPKAPIITLSWHWNAPFGLLDRVDKAPDGKEIDRRWYRGFYTDATTFDVSKAANDPASPERAALLSDIDAIAPELSKLQAAKVPVLFRPLHEASGGWFWWGAKGPAPALWLWKTLRERLSGKWGIHNLIWVWNSPDAKWYPGDDAVDVVSVDEYPNDRRDPLTARWEDLLRRFDGKKLLALGEYPGPSDVERAARFGVRWAYSVSWTGSLGPTKMDPTVVRAIYRSPRAITLRDWNR